MEQNANQNHRKMVLQKVTTSIKRIAKRKSTYLILTVTLVTLLGVTFFMKVKSNKAIMANRPVNVSTAKIEKRDLSNSISLTGTLASANSKSISTTLNNIKINKVYISVGDEIKAGDVICEFDASDIENNLQSAKESLATTVNKNSVELESSQSNLENAQIVRDLEKERADTSVANAYNEYSTKQTKESEAYHTYIANQNATTAAYNEYQSFQTSLQEANTALNSLIAEFNSNLKNITDNNSVLSNIMTGVTIDSTLDSLGIPDDALDTDKQAFLDAIASLKTLQSKYTDATEKVSSATTNVTNAQKKYETAQGVESTSKNTYEQSQAETKSAANAYTQSIQNKEDTIRNNEKNVSTQESNLELTKINQSNAGSTQQQQIEDYTAQIENCKVIAPFDGVITSVSLEEGSMYTGGEICVLQDASSFIVEASVDQYDISDIVKGMNAVIKTDTTEDLLMNGTITFISPTPTTNTSIGSSNTNYPIKITISDPSERLRLGMTAKVNVLLEESNGVLSVPYDSVMENANGESVVYVIDQENKENKKEVVVKTGLETDYYVAIISDELTEGMEVFVPNNITSSDTQNTMNTNTTMTVMPIGNMKQGGEARPQGSGMSSGGPRGNE